MSPDMFGKPEVYGVVLAEEEKPETRRVHVTGHVTIEVEIDEWIDVEPDETNAEIKHAAIEAAGIIFDSRAEVDSYHLHIHDETREQAKKQLAKERALLASWNAGLPLGTDGPPR